MRNWNPENKEEPALKVVFMGTPSIAAACLEKILADGWQVAAVYTQPDRPKNRGMKLAYSAVKEVALAHGLPVYQPENFRSPETVAELAALQPDVIAVVAYGRILPQSVLDIPPKGCINIHASLLPAYRGSAPYQWAVLDGCEKTGVTAMYLCSRMDAGDIIDTAETPIGENETAGALLDRLAVLGAELLLSGCCLRSMKLRKLLCGKPVILVDGGKPLQSNLRKTRITLDELTGMLRQNNILDIRTVQYAILETSGNLSVFP